MATSDETDDRIGQGYRRPRPHEDTDSHEAVQTGDATGLGPGALCQTGPDSGDTDAAAGRVSVHCAVLPAFQRVSRLSGVLHAVPVVFEYQGVGQGSLFWIDLGPVYIEIPQIAQLNFVGLGNYARLLGNDLFWQSMFNTSYILVIQVPLMIGLALALALALNASFLRLKGVFRTAIALPVSANLVAYSTVFLLLFNEQLGFLNYVLAGVGIGPVPWLTDGFWARNTIIAAVTWRWTGTT